MAESAVVASPDGLRGQIVKAFIVPTSQYAEQVRREGDRERLIGEVFNSPVSHLNLRFSAERCAVSPQSAFQYSILRCSKFVSNWGMTVLLI